MDGFEYCGVGAGCRYVSTLAGSEVFDPRLVCPSVGHSLRAAWMKRLVLACTHLLLLESMFATKPPAYPDEGGADCWRHAVRPIPWGSS